MKDIQWFYIGAGAALAVLAQIGAWFQHNLQFKFPKYDESWWGWYALSVPLTYVFVLSTKYHYKGYGESVWAGRFAGFAIGIIVYAALIQIFFDEKFTTKIAVQIALCFVILAVQAFWKTKA